MTKEPIMIDYVDVSECEFYNKVIGEDAYCNIDEEHLCTCISYDNCYYKQLKRKEQECEWLKLWLPIVTKIEKQFGNLKKAKDIDYLAYTEQIFAELDQLKTELKPFKDEYFKGLDNIIISELAKKSIRITAENRKLENALQEIKEIAELDVHIVGGKKFYYDSIEQILQKCEVIDE